MVLFLFYRTRGERFSMRQFTMTNLNTVAPIAYENGMLNNDALTLVGLDYAGTDSYRKWIDP